MKTLAFGLTFLTISSSVFAGSYLHSITIHNPGGVPFNGPVTYQTGSGVPLNVPVQTQLGEPVHFNGAIREPAAVPTESVPAPEPVPYDPKDYWPQPGQYQQN